MADIWYHSGMLTNRQKAYTLILLGLIGLFLPILPGVILVLIGAALLVDKKGRLDVDLARFSKKRRAGGDAQKK